MTSNMGSHIIRENFAHADKDNIFGVVESTKIEVMDLLKKTIRPEFLNRIDEIIMFRPLDKNSIESIVRIQIDNLAKMLSETGVNVRFTDEAVSALAAQGYEPEFGARPLKRVLQREVINQLSKYILAGKVDREAQIVIDVNSSGRIVFENAGHELQS